MKRFICGFLAGATLFVTAGVFAVQYAANPVDFKVLVNGKEFTSDPPALEVNGRTYLPLRAIGDALGVPVSWNEELRQAEVGNSTAEAAVDNSEKTPVEYRNALKKAEIYSETLHMSKQKIYDQLTSEYGEKFSAEAAQYAIDNIQADWNKNALEKARSYQETLHMSKQKIYDQLTSEYGEKFTAEEAQYAIDNLDN